MLGIMALKQESQNPPEYENRLREKRQALGLSQKQLADLAGITRQAVSAVEANQYSPATSVALHLARALRCRVDDLFSIKSGGGGAEGGHIGSLPGGGRPRRGRAPRSRGRPPVRPPDGRRELGRVKGAPAA